MPGQQHDDAELLADLRRVADELGHEPTHTDYLRFGRFAPATLGNRFATWTTAKREAGL